MDKLDIEIKKPEMEEFIEKLRHYVRAEQRDDYRVETVIQDIVYLLGVSIDKEKFEFAQGSDKFNKILIDAIGL